MEQESTDPDGVLTQPQCPTEPHLSGVSLVVAALLIFFAFHCLVAVLERHNTQPRRKIKRVAISHVERSVMKTSPASRAITRQRSQQSRAVRARSEKTVRFAAAPSVQYIQPLYEPADFYDDT